MLTILRRCWPSPATIIATAAVVFASAGVASSAPFSTDSHADKQLFRQLLANAAPNLSVKFATSAGQATTAHDATTAGNAQMLGGLPASAYQPGNCQVGTIKGSLVIKGTDLVNVPTNSEESVGGFNCTGGGVQIRQTSEGVFYVYFPGLTDGTGSTASGSCVISALVANTGGEPISTTCEKAFDSGFGHTSFLVQTLENGSPAEVGFSLLAF